MLVDLEKKITGAHLDDVPEEQSDGVVPSSVCKDLVVQEIMSEPAALLPPQSKNERRHTASCPAVIARHQDGGSSEE